MYSGGLADHRDFAVGSPGRKWLQTRHNSGLPSRMRSEVLQEIQILLAVPAIFRSTARKSSGMINAEQYSA
jgi:hypothetical protein